MAKRGSLIHWYVKGEHCVGLEAILFLLLQSAFSKGYWKIWKSADENDSRSGERNSRMRDLNNYLLGSQKKKKKEQGYFITMLYNCMEMPSWEERLGF